MNSLEFEEALVSSEWGLKYLDFIEKAKSKNLSLKKEPGFNIHHIQPKALGGTNEEENKVKLTSVEHCIAHGLLAKALPSYKTLKPITKMSFGQYKELSDLEKLTIDECVGWGELYKDSLRVGVKHTQETKNKISAAHKGKPKSEETKKKISNTLKGRPHPWSEQHRERYKEYCRVRGVPMLHTDEAHSRRKQTSLERYGNPAGRILEQEIRARAISSIQVAWKRNRELISSSEFLEWFSQQPKGKYRRRTDALKDYRNGRQLVEERIS